MRITSSVGAAETMQLALVHCQHHCYEQNQEDGAHRCLLIAPNDAIVVMAFTLNRRRTSDGQHSEAYSFDRDRATVQGGRSAGRLRLLDVRQSPRSRIHRSETRFNHARASSSTSVRRPIVCADGGPSSQKPMAHRTPRTSDRGVPLPAVTPSHNPDDRRTSARTPGGWGLLGAPR
jgi:hypothetical protein